MPLECPLPAAVNLPAGLPVWLADLYVRDLRELAAAGDAEAAQRLEAATGVPEG